MLFNKGGLKNSLFYKGMGANLPKTKRAHVSKAGKNHLKRAEEKSFLERVHSTKAENGYVTKAGKNHLIKAKDKSILERVHSTKA
jgi:hypothetical protein